ncbi:MAG: 4-alpha-glucanotransferase, partial [Bacteroidales bacterium]|nr:4-alpha-glucanotransferase [Bacteroidales bacterium]
MMRLEIEYATLWGESLAVESSTGVRYPLQWAGNNIWAADFKRFPRKEFSSYEYLLLRDGIVERCEWDVHHLPENFRGSVKRDSWIEAPAGAGPFIRKHLNPRFDAAGFRGAGTVIPVFSLRSESSFGIGEFSDLKLLADWAAATGQCILQLLPVNDTTRKGDWADSYPYSPVSSFALHPLYIRLQDVGVEETPEFLRVKEELEALPELDYPRVFSTKMAFLRAAFSAKGKTDVQSAAFRDFCARNAFWLDEYAAFCAKRDGVEADFHRWLQFHLDRQFSGAVAYAREKGVCFKGDLPIGVSADSADACFHPELFNLDSTAGAPPDFFSEHGQNWGFPTYNWEKMAEDNYSWWKRRLRKMAEYFDAYRIDHILGFFRIWEIPVKEKSGTEGHFNPSLPYTRKEIEALGLWGRKGLFLEDPRHPGRYVPRIRPASETLPEGLQRTFGALYDDFFFHR